MPFYLLESPFSEQYTKRVDLKDDDAAIEYATNLSGSTGCTWFAYRFIFEADGRETRDAELPLERNSSIRDGYRKAKGTLPHFEFDDHNDPA